MVFSVAIASTAFSIADLIFTKLDIDRKEHELLSSLYYLSKHLQEFYMNEISKKYENEAEQLMSVLMELFTQDEIDKILYNKLTDEEKEELLNKADSCNEQTKILISNYINSDIESDMVNNEDETDVDLLLKAETFKQKIKYILASTIAVLGLTSLLIILTIRLEPLPTINNALTLLAFLSVVITLLLKEYYKSDSLKNLNKEKTKLLNEVKNRNP